VCQIVGDEHDADTVVTDSIDDVYNWQLDKAYDPNQTEDDMVERYEEMNRMREHVMKEVDSNQDRLISLEEFLDSTQQSDFKKDQGWDVWRRYDCSLTLAVSVWAV